MEQCLHSSARLQRRLCKSAVDLHKLGFIATGVNLETSMFGVFAVGEGATVVLMIRPVLGKEPG